MISTHARHADTIMVVHAETDKHPKHKRSSRESRNLHRIHLDPIHSCTSPQESDGGTHVWEETNISMRLGEACWGSRRGIKKDVNKNPLHILKYQPCLKRWIILQHILPTHWFMSKTFLNVLLNKRSCTKMSSISTFPSSLKTHN